MKISIKNIFLLGALLLLTSCASGANQSAMVPSNLSSATAKTQYRSAININSVVGGDKTNPLWVSKISNTAFKSSLTSTLRARGYYNPSGPYKLDTKLVKVQQPLLGVNYTVTAVVEYTIHDTRNGKLVFNELITAPYTAKFSDSLLGVQRLRLANEGAGRENIRLFIKALESQ